MIARLFDLDAVLFDLDGVLTSTAALHAAAWKSTFDRVLGELAGLGQGEQRPFNDEDYRRYVDGMPRSDGVRSFLASRGIVLPEGEAGDPPSRLTVAAVAAGKDALLQASLAPGGITAFPGSVALVRQLRARGTRVAVVSASRNCGAILRAAGIDDLFDAQVDGLVAADLGLRGKPAPDTFLAAARQLGVEPAQAAVVEDALAGVEAGRAGGFALVIGVDRADARRQLLEHGADIVVRDLAELLEHEGETGKL
jgi:beta-phosphoglucomutase family hydrolase